MIHVPPGAIVGLLDDFWQRSLVDVGLPVPTPARAGTFHVLPPGRGFYPMFRHEE